MRFAQYRILKNILEKIQIPDYIHAFEKGKSIPGMAQIHVGKKTVISLDLKDFFTSIKQFHLVQVFTHLGFGQKPATLLSELCTYDSFVPQGALTSPKVSNIITALTFGPLIKTYCESKGLTLSIYADDITISSDEVLKNGGGRLSPQKIIHFVRRAIGKYGFALNNDKIKVMQYHERQYVCGAVVNRKVNMLKTERMKLKGIVHLCESKGLEAQAERSNETVDQFSSRIMGRLNWYAQLNPENGELLKTKFKEVCADRIMCPTAVTESVKTTEPLDSLPTQDIIDESSVPW